MSFNWNEIANIDFNITSPQWIFDIQKEIDGNKKNYNIGYVDDDGIMRLNNLSVKQFQSTGLTHLGNNVSIGNYNDVSDANLTVKGEIVCRKIFMDEPQEVAGIHKITGSILCCNTTPMDYLGSSDNIDNLNNQMKKGWGSAFIENCLGIFSLYNPTSVLLCI